MPVQFVPEPNETPPERSGFRFLSLALLGAAVLIEWLVLALLDTSFWFQKKELNAIYGRPMEKLPRIYAPLDPRVFSPYLPPEQLERRLKEAYGAIFHYLEQPDNPAVRLEIINSKGERVYQWEPSNADEKRRRFNTWKNSLFSRDFEFPVRNSEIPHLTVIFVNSPNLPQVEELAVRYRVYALLFTLGNVVVTLLLYLGAVRPLGRIAQALSIPSGQLPPYIPNPRHEAERAYNTMASGTRSMIAQSGISDLWEDLSTHEMGKLEDPERFWLPSLKIIRECMAYHPIAWVPIGRGNENSVVSPTPEEWGTASPADRLQAIAEQKFHLGEGASDVFEVFYCSEKKEWFAEPRNAQLRMFFVGIVRRKEEPAGFLLGAPTQGDSSLGETLFRNLVRQLSLILTRSLERREEIDRGRFEVSIDLSASMGHDLTNILATGRLELETLRTAFNRGFLRVEADKRPAVEAALEGLRKTTVLLQEVVNVYRAFSFTRKPHFEQIELNALSAEVIELYRHSTSRRVDYHLVKVDEVVYAYADPRLLKLVLFNLLANATQAIAERQTQEPDLTGRVEVDCRVQEDWSVLRVTDNGTGFQNAEGHRLEGVELQQVFQFDFTTKKRRGGLGLAWVRSIVEEIHEGRLVPSNRKDQLGAVMEVFLPPEVLHSQQGIDVFPGSDVKKDA